MTIFQLQKEVEESLLNEQRLAESKQIIKHILGTDTTGLVLMRSREASVKQVQTAREIVSQRNGGRPLDYILGRTQFYSLEFLVGEGVLIPRADTEVLVDKALEKIKDIKNPKVLDLCAGSGAISIAIAKNRPDAQVSAVELYSDAYEFLQKNIELNEVKNVRAILADALKFTGDYDLVVSNPPYIDMSERKDLSQEVLKEPETALFAEDNGLYFYKTFAKNFAEYENFLIMFEIGYTQSQKVCEILSTYGYKNIEKTPDLNGIIRVIKAEK